MAAARGVRAASPTMSCRCGAVTAKSSAAGRPPVQQGRYTSGRRYEAVSDGLAGKSSPDFSISGRRPALQHKLKMMFRTPLCRMTRSPPAQHRRQWWPKGSRTSSHNGQKPDSSPSGMHRRYRTSAQNSAAGIAVPRDRCGMACYISRAPFSHSESSVA